jgi:hypothetical protein
VSSFLLSIKSLPLVREVQRSDGYTGVSEQAMNVVIPGFPSCYVCVESVYFIARMLNARPRARKFAVSRDAAVRAWRLRQTFNSIWFCPQTSFSRRPRTELGRSVIVMLSWVSRVLSGPPFYHQCYSAIARRHVFSISSCL